MWKSPRDRAIQYLTALHHRRGGSRFQMLIFTAISAVTGVLASILLHAAGMTSMVIRYPLCVGVAYLSFLVLLSSFVSYHRSTRRKSPSGTSRMPHLDLTGLQSLSPSGGQTSSTAPGSSSSGSGFSLAGIDGDGILVAIVVLIAFGAAMLAGGFVVYKAPVILAEILADGVLLVRLARRSEFRESPNWIDSALRRTALPVIALTICFFVVGLALENIVPGATTMTQAIQMAHSR